MSEPQISLQGRRVEASFELVNGLSDELFERIQAGLAEGFDFDFALFLDHKRWFDNKIDSTSFEVVVMYNAVTQDYLVNYKHDGKLVESRVVRTREELERAMTKFDGISLFTLEEPESNRQLLVRARADLGSKTVLFLIPRKVTTEWVRSRKFRIEEE